MSIYKHIFGPVPSHRLGVSLGIDLVPYKTCSLNCVYCECGRTTDLTLDRKEYVPSKDVIAELNEYLYDNPSPDYITFSGSGEPTLHSGIGDIINYIKKNYPNILIAVLTNATLFSEKEVRQSLIGADVVLPSLDVATSEAFNKINRPHKLLAVEKHIEGIVEFRNDFKGSIWLEVFILPGYNDSDKELFEMKNAIFNIKPNILQLNTLDRPGAISGLIPANEDMLLRVADYIDYPNTEIIAKRKKRKEVKSYNKDVDSAILQTISRRPCTVDDLCEILGLHINEVNKYLSQMQNDKKIAVTDCERGIFYFVNDKNIDDK